MDKSEMEYLIATLTERLELEKETNRIHTGYTKSLQATVLEFNALVDKYRLMVKKLLKMS